jgi:DNA mismatch repair ATPase MutS
MKAHLLYPDKDFDAGAAPLPNRAALVADLDLERLFAAMSGGDKFLADVAAKVILASLTNPDEIGYRNSILADAIANPAMVREMYAIAVEAMDRERRVWMGAYERYPQGLLHRSIEVMEIFVGSLTRLREVAETNADLVKSAGLRNLFDELSRELADSYLASVKEHLQNLTFTTGVLSSAELGEGNKGDRYVLRRPLARKRNWRERLLGDRSGFVYQLDPRDESGAQALGELRARGVALAATSLASSVDHVLAFFSMLRFELGFYVGALNLRELLVARGAPTCMPEALDAADRELQARDLYDVSLVLSLGERAVGNDLDGGGKSVVFLTGANRGGKSTLLRAVGIAFLMMQSGMFVGADSFRASVASRILTHFRREEDATMTSGKLDEELHRMSDIVDLLRRDSLVLFNESFASTNEREGSEIGRQIVRALLARGVRICYVTHLYDLAHGFWLESRIDAAFLRAERLADGRRTFRLLEGEPLPTSHGQDLYRKIFGAEETEERAVVRVSR